MRLSLKERIKVWLIHRKVHKLKLTNRFSELVVAFVRVIFSKLACSEKTKELEEAFRLRFDTKRAIVFPHARTALYFILKAMELEKGSEVLMTPLTIADMVNSIHTLGLKPVFVDIELNTFCFDIEKLRKAMTPRSKVILITYIFGIVPDVTKIQEIAKEYDLKIIEDCSQCFDASYRGQFIGTFGEAAFFSLTNFKVCSSLFGGMIITNNENLKEKLNNLREKDLFPPRSSILLKLLMKNLIYTIFFLRGMFSYFTYFFVLLLENIDPKITYRLYSGNIKVILGQFGNRLYSRFPSAYLTNYTDIQADVGLASLKRAEEITLARIANGDLLMSQLQNIPGVKIPVKLDGAVNVYWRFPIITRDMWGLKRFLLNHGIDSAPTYLTLCSKEPSFEPYHTYTPNAEILKEDVLVVEVNEDLNETDILRTAKLIRAYFNNQTKTYNSYNIHSNTLEWNSKIIKSWIP